MSVEELLKAFSKSLTLKDKVDATEFGIKGLSDIQQAELDQWYTLSTRFPEAISQLNEALKDRTYLTSSQELSLADAVVLGKVMPFLKQWTNEEIIAKRHVIRWADLVQNTILVPEGEKLKVSVDLEAPREIKAKPEKKKNNENKAEEKLKEETKEETKEEPKESKPSNEEESDKAVYKAAEKKGVKKEKKKKTPQPPKEEAPITPGMIDLRVGHIEKAVKHPDADSLYVSTIHMGDEEGPRTVCSGLVKYIPIEEMQGRDVIVVANLKPVTMRGIKSCAMVLCASNEDVVQFVNPPPGSKPGDKIFFETYDITPEPVLNPKKKIWETIQPGFSTTESLEVVFRKEGEPDRKLLNKKGEMCLVKSLIGAVVR